MNLGLVVRLSTDVTRPLSFVAYPIFFRNQPLRNCICRRNIDTWTGVHPTIGIISSDFGNKPVNSCDVVMQASVRGESYELGIIHWSNRLQRDRTVPHML